MKTTQPAGEHSAVEREGRRRQVPGVDRPESGLRSAHGHADGAQIAEANLTDWRKLGQGLHARYLVGDFGAGVRFVAALGEAGDD